MTVIQERLNRIVDQLPPMQVLELLDFAEFLRQRAETVTDVSWMQPYGALTDDVLVAMADEAFVRLDTEEAHVDQPIAQ